MLATLPNVLLYLEANFGERGGKIEKWKDRKDSSDINNASCKHVSVKKIRTQLPKPTFSYFCPIFPLVAVLYNLCLAAPSRCCLEGRGKNRINEIK